MSEVDWTQVKNQLGAIVLLLLVIVVLLVWQLFHTPKPVQRFLPFREGPRLALDTKTGKLCSTLPQRSLTDEEIQKLENEPPKEPPKVEIPVCSELE